MEDKYPEKTTANLTVHEDEIHLQELFDMLIQGKKTIAFMIALMSIIGVSYSLLLPNIYESRTILSPVDQSNTISGAFQNYSALAGLAGINLQPSGGDSNSKKAIKKLKTLSFFKNNVMTEIYLPDLMAFKSWDMNTNTLIYDEGLYDVNKNTWVRKFSHPNKQIPSAQESFEVFMNKHVSINEDNKTGFVTLTVRHQSPFLAKQWAEVLIDQVNTFYRLKDKIESQKAISYLNNEILSTNLSEIKQSIVELLQQEIKKLTLIEANQSYVFEYIDPPAVMEQKSEPSRSIICILSSIFGGILGIIIVFIKNYLFNTKKIN